MQMHLCIDFFAYEFGNEPHRNHCYNHNNANQTKCSILHICLLVCYSHNPFLALWAFVVLVSLKRFSTKISEKNIIFLNKYKLVLMIMSGSANAEHW